MIDIIFIIFILYLFLLPEFLYSKIDMMLQRASKNRLKTKCVFS